MPTRQSWISLALLFAVLLTLPVARALGQIGATNIPRLSNVRFADQFGGASADAKIAAAISDLPDTGGTVVTVGLEGVQSISATVNVGSSTKPVVLILGAATFSGSADPLFQIEKNSAVITSINTTIKATAANTGFLVYRSGSYVGDMNVKILGGGTLDGNNVGLRGVRLRDVGHVEVDLNVTGWLHCGGCMGGATAGTQNIIWRGAYFQNYGDGILTEEVTNHNDILIGPSAKVTGNWASGVFSAGMRNARLYGDFEGNGTYGICNTSTTGNTVTQVSGNHNFSTNWSNGGAARTIKINGVLYAVSSIDSSTQLTLMSSPGNQTAVNFAFGNEVGLGAADNFDIHAYVETSSNNPEYVAIQMDGGTSAGSSGRIKGNFFQNNATQATAISLHGLSNSMIGEIASSSFNGFTTAINVGAADVTIQPSRFVGVTNEVVVGSGIGRAIRAQAGKLQSIPAATTGIGLDVHDSATVIRTGTITNATNASPIQLTSTSHGLNTGDSVYIAGVGGNTAANGFWTVIRVDANHFSLKGSTGTGTYTSGGTFTSRANFQVIANGQTNITTTTGGITPLSLQPGSAPSVALLQIKDESGTLQTYVNSAYQIASNVATGTAPFSITSTTPVANLTAGPTTFNSAGTQQTNAHLVVGNATISAGGNVAITLSGSAVFSTGTSYACSGANASGARTFQLSLGSGSGFTITGTANDVILYVCAGN